MLQYQYNDKHKLIRLSQPNVSVSGKPCKVSVSLYKLQSSVYHTWTRKPAITNGSHTWRM